MKQVVAQALKLGVATAIQAVLSFKPQPQTHIHQLQQMEIFSRVFLQKGKQLKKPFTTAGFTMELAQQRLLAPNTTTPGALVHQLI